METEYLHAFYTSMRGYHNCVKLISSTDETYARYWNIQHMYNLAYVFPSGISDKY